MKTSTEKVSERESSFPIFSIETTYRELGRNTQSDLKLKVHSYGILDSFYFAEKHLDFGTIMRRRIFIVLILRNKSVKALSTVFHDVLTGQGCQQKSLKNTRKLEL